MESVLLQCSGDVLTVLRGNPDSDHAAKKRDDTHIPIAFQMYWLNAGICTGLTIKQWDQHAVVLQEKLLLGIWKRNMARSFGRQFRRRKNKHRVGAAISFVIRDRLVEELHSGKELVVDLCWKEDVVATRDCIVRACSGTWWDWVIGSRPFFWRWPEDY